MSLIAPTLESFFTDRLVKQQHASPATIGPYRDSLRMLLTYAQEHTGKTPARLDWADLDETLIGGFLDSLETERHNSPRTRNLRLTGQLLLPTAPRTRSNVPTRPGNTTQTLRTGAGVVPHRRGDRRAR